MLPQIQYIEHLFALGIFAGLLVGGWFIFLAGWQSGMGLRWLDVYLFSILGGIIGARVGYVLLHLSEFSASPEYVFRLWYGALSWQGAFLGAALVMLLLCQSRQIPLAEFTDAVAVALPVILMSVGWACRKAGCLVSNPVADVDDYPVWMVGYLRDLQGNVLPRYELQMLAISLFWLIFIGIGFLTLQNRARSKRLSVALVWVGVSLLILFRLQNAELTLDKISAVILIGIGVVGAGTRRLSLGFGVWQPIHHADSRPFDH